MYKGYKQLTKDKIQMVLKHEKSVQFHNDIHANKNDMEI